MTAPSGLPGGDARNAGAGQPAELTSSVPAVQSPRLATGGRPKIYSDGCAYPGCEKHRAYGRSMCVAHRNLIQRKNRPCVVTGCERIAPIGSVRCDVHRLPSPGKREETSLACARPGCGAIAEYGRKICRRHRRLERAANGESTQHPKVPCKTCGHPSKAGQCRGCYMLVARKARMIRCLGCGAKLLPVDDTQQRRRAYCNDQCVDAARLKRISQKEPSTVESDAKLAALHKDALAMPWERRRQELLRA